MYADLLISIALFTAYLLPQAMFINGVKLSASGSTEIKPDGTEHDSEMILYPLAKYINQRTMDKVYFTGALFNSLISDIVAAYPALDTDTIAITDLQKQYWVKQRHMIERTFDIKVEITEQNMIRFYREYSNWKFSKYIRKPTFGCIVCMPSLWGIITFLVPGLIIFHFDLLVVALYIPNTFCLAYLNYKICKPL